MSFRMGIGITTGNAVKSFDFAQDGSEWRGGDLSIE